jgi:hypothetical protein
MTRCLRREERGSSTLACEDPRRREGRSSEEIAVAVANADSDVGGGRSLAFSHRRASQTDGADIECWRSSSV